MPAASDNTACLSATGFLANLVEGGKIDRIVADRVIKVASETGDSIPRILMKLELLTQSDLAHALTKFCGLQLLAEPSTLAGDCGVVNSTFLKEHEIALLPSDPAELSIVCWDPLENEPVTLLHFATGLPIQRLVTTRENILEWLSKIHPDAESKHESVALDRSVSFEGEAVERLVDLASDAPIIRLLQSRITQAVRMRASDIHFEANDKGLTTRFRLDGILREVFSDDQEVGTALVSRLKVMAGLDIAERRLPQDGRIRTLTEGRELDLRVATSPTLHGESVVLRILDRKDVALDFEALGFDNHLRQMLVSAVSKPHGIVLVTGPTGSGKTTTLYAALKEISTPEKKILTVEDPVEYQLAGINQVPVKPQIGLTFAAALRAFLRQDPDIMMVGEIRDSETAEIAIQAALTGHLLLSTLHTNSAAAAVTRLKDMGVPDYLLTSTLELILGQRLVRRLCPDCREIYRPSAELLERIGVSEDNEISWYRAAGCKSCHGLGYRGRTAILEAMPMTERLRAQILAGVDAHELHLTAVADGMRPLFGHGLARVMAGETTLEEVLRVTSLH